MKGRGRETMSKRGSMLFCSRCQQRFRDISNAFLAIPRASFLLSIAIGEAHFAIQAGACGSEGAETPETMLSGAAIGCRRRAARSTAVLRRAVAASFFRSKLLLKKNSLSLSLNFQQSTHLIPRGTAALTARGRRACLQVFWREGGDFSLRFFFSPARFERVISSSRAEHFFSRQRLALLGVNLFFFLLLSSSSSGFLLPLLAFACPLPSFLVSPPPSCPHQSLKKRGIPSRIKFREARIPPALSA